jgi:hypothetical protein
MKMILLDLKDKVDMTLVKVRKLPGIVLCSIDCISKDKDRK